jgi:hypothetical protein
VWRIAASAGGRTKILDLWFDGWEVFLVNYGFATVKTNGELAFDIDDEANPQPGRDVYVA